MSRLALSTLALLLLAFAADPGRADAPFAYRYFDEPVDLSPDPARVAFLVNGAATGSAALLGPADRDLRARGIATGTIASHAIAGWRIAEIDPARQAAGGLASVVAELRDVPGIAFATPVFEDDTGMPLWATPYILVRFDEKVSRSRARDVLLDAGLSNENIAEWGGMSGSYRVRTTGLDGFGVLALANVLALRPDTHYAEPDMIFSGRAGYFPNEPDFANCWGLHNTGQSGGTPDADMDAVEAWDITFGSSSQIVVVIDTGVEQTHPDIEQIPGADLTGEGGGGGPVNACDNHGTPVAGCVSGTIDNTLGTVGVAPGVLCASARTFISTAACNGNWTSTASWTVDAITYAENLGARVTNNSNLYGFTSSAIASKYATSRLGGMVHFAAAGNNGTNVIGYPANLPDVNAVAALNRFGQRAGFSQFGVGLAFSAPGAAIYTTDRSGTDGYAPGEFVVVNGTSFASPYTAGVAALVLSVAPGFDAFQVENALQQTCVDLGAPGYETNFGWGFVNAYQAVSGSMSVDAPDVAPSRSGAMTANSFPNPFTDATSVRFALPRDENVRVSVVDVAGRLVRVLDERRRTAGAHDVAWDGLDAQGARVAAGVFFVRVSTASGELTERVVRVR